MAKTTTYALLAWLSLSCTDSIQGATFHTSPSGHDSNPGTYEHPWRTIQHAADTLMPGETVVVQEGNYDERIVTLRDGMEGLRIVFTASGPVVVKGWDIGHAYHTVDGFDITGWSSPDRYDGHVRIRTGGHHFEMTRCTVRDGIGISRTDMMFTSPNTISTANGGFLAAGFKPGQSIEVLRATNITVTSAGTYVIDSVTDTYLTVTSSNIVAEGPKPAYITGAANWGLSFASGVQHALIHSNTFSNLSYIPWFIHGYAHRLENNRITQNNGWNVMHISGSDHVIRRNHIYNNKLGVFRPSADVFDTFSAIYERIEFSENFVEDFVGVINVQKSRARDCGPLLIRKNVFIDIGRFAMRGPNITVENNTFLRAARNANAAVARASHPIFVNTADNATNAVIRNNIFVDCGEPSSSQNEAQVGWYEVSGPTDSFMAEFNFVAGGAPGFGPKTGFDEGIPALNGGEPGFVNVDDPLGPDGIPFTADDGLRLRPDSKLVGVGFGSVDLGAYNMKTPRPRLMIELGSSNTARLLWPVCYADYALFSGASVTGPWQTTASPPVQEGLLLVSTNDMNLPKQFFRLIK